MKNRLLFSLIMLSTFIPTNLQSMGGSGSEGSAAYLSAIGGTMNISATSAPMASSNSTAGRTCDKDFKAGAEPTKKPSSKLTGDLGMGEEYQAQQNERAKKIAAADMANTSAGTSTATASGNLQPAYSNPLLNAVGISASLAKRILENPPAKVKLLIDRVKKGNVEQLESSEKVLFFVGPSGTGKTCMVKAIANQCGNLSSYVYPAVSVGNQFVQSGNKNLQKIFEDASFEAKATNKPVIIVLDELQKLFENHTNEKDPSSSFITALWSILDSYANDKVIFIGLFNPIKCEVPSQIKTRYGRVIIATDLPDRNDRIEIIKFHMDQYKTKKIDAAVLNLIGTLGGMTSGFCHRELAEFIKEASDISEVRKHPVIMLDDCYEAITVMNNLRTRTQLVDKKNWGEWIGNNWKFLTGSALSAAAIGASVYLGVRSLRLQEAAQAAAAAANAAAVASQEKSNIFNRFMALISYQLNWNTAQKAALPKIVWSWSDVEKYSKSTGHDWTPAEAVRHLLKSGLTLADLGLDRLSTGALSLLELPDGMKKP